MTPLEQIDSVFFFIKSKEQISARWSTEYIWNLYVKKDSEAAVNKQQFDEIINQLVSDDYIRELPVIDSSQKTYHVTFKGRIFNGYIDYQNSLTENNKRIVALEEENRKFQKSSLRSSRQLNLLTAILAAGTLLAAVYYILEIVSWFCIYPRK